MLERDGTVGVQRQRRRRRRLLNPLRRSKCGLVLDSRSTREAFFVFVGVLACCFLCGVQAFVRPYHGHKHQYYRSSNSFGRGRSSNSKRNSVKEGETGTFSMDELAREMKERSSSGTPYTPEEVSAVLEGIRSLLPAEGDGDGEIEAIDWDGLGALLRSRAHLSHKDWDVTAESASLLEALLLPNHSDSDEENESLPETFRSIMERVIDEGGWDGAMERAQSRNSESAKSKPWAVLVSGVNGIRKTTSVYQPWFREVLKEALVVPSSLADTNTEFDVDDLFDGHDSFFRQLDHVVAVLTNVEFARLYSMTDDLVDGSDSSEQRPWHVAVDAYARLKDAIFVRYRTLAEMLGLVFLRGAVRRGANVLVETSGRDVAMFTYLDRFVPTTSYRKLALHFVVNDVGHAEASVDRRMVDEIQRGVEAVASLTTTGNVTRGNRETTTKVVYANQGGPYGSEVLKGVQEASDRVWLQDVLTGAAIGDDWYTAEILIEGNDDPNQWKAVAVHRNEDGTYTRGQTVHVFQRR